MLPDLYLGLENRDSFRRLQSLLKTEISDLTFTNLFMWQLSFGLRPSYLEAVDYWLLLAQPPRYAPFFLPPLGDWSDLDRLKKALEKMDEIAAHGQWEFLMKRAPRRLALALRQIDPSLQLKEDRRTFDYIYRSGDLITLSGRKYHSKRNHISQFRRKYTSWEYRRIDAEVLAEILALNVDWFYIREDGDREQTDEEQAMTLVMKNFKALDVVGGVIMIDGRIQAIAVGEPLNQDTAVIHIEKANTDFEGIYAVINQQFTADYFKDFQFINREEDLGLEGLRKAKLSYHPAFLVEKFKISRSQG
ncbi:MAG: phosphatidylglycerol lysyltransferase domain-containing protein [Firmicutes bacterium]|nr:phosphatidylglycerol lysyltransferase domain-containing protein [Bacillota bacterium]